MTCGCNSFLFVGMSVVVLRLINLCTGDPRLLFLGVVLNSRIAKYGSFLSSFAFLAHLRAFSMVLRVLRPVSGVVCEEHKSHIIEDNKPLLYTYGSDFPNCPFGKKIKLEKKGISPKC